MTADHPLHDAQSRILWNEVSRLLAECESLFATLVGQEAPPALRERDQRTADLLLLSSQSLIITIGQIHRRVVSELLDAHSYEEMMLWTLLAGLAGLGISLFLLLRKGILVPLWQLHGTSSPYRRWTTGSPSAQPPPRRIRPTGPRVRPYAGPAPGDHRVA